MAQTTCLFKDGKRRGSEREIRDGRRVKEGKERGREGARERERGGGGRKLRVYPIQQRCEQVSK